MDGVAMMSGTDGELLARVRAGDRGALGELVERHGDFVFAAAARVMGSEAAAGDVMQGVFLLLMRSPPGHEKLVGWLHGAVRNVARNARRGERRRGIYEKAAAMEKREEQVSELGIRVMVDEAIGRLSAMDREVVLRHYLEGWSARELAGMLKLSEAAVQKRLTRAMEKLRQQMVPAHSSVSVSSVLAVLAAERGVVAPAAVKTAVMKAGVMKAGVSGAGSSMAQELVRRSVMQAMMKKAAAVVCLIAATGGIGAAAVVWGGGGTERVVVAQNALAVPTQQKVSGVPRAEGDAGPATAQAVVMAEQRKIKVVMYALFLYARKHDGTLPKTLGEAMPHVTLGLLENAEIEPSDGSPSQQIARVFLSDREWKGKALPQPVTEEWVTKNASWVYVTGGVKLAEVKDAGATVGVHEPLDKGIEVEVEGKKVKVFPAGYLDGHVEAEVKEAVETRVAASKKVIEGLREK